MPGQSSLVVWAAAAAMGFALACAPATAAPEPTAAPAPIAAPADQAETPRASYRARHGCNVYGIERWRPAIESYVPAVRPGIQRTIGTAAAPFAAYIGRMQQRLDFEFRDRFLKCVKKLPAPMKKRGLSTTLELVIDPEWGRVANLGVVRSSGYVLLDIYALEIVTRAGPFERAPAAIVSEDGKVYLIWEIHAAKAPSAADARPFILSRPPPPANSSP